MNQPRSNGGGRAGPRAGLRSLLVVSVAAAMLSPSPAAAATEAVAMPAQASMAIPASAAAAGAASVPATAQAQPARGSEFADVGEQSVHRPAVEALAAQGVFEGTECGQNQFCPHQPILRSTVAVWLVRVLDDAEPTADSSRFSDVDATEWWSPYVERLADLGVTKGCALGKYCPDRPVTREQMASFLVRAFDLPAGPAAGFSDVAVTNVHYANINALAKAGVTTGCTPQDYCPRRSTSRAQMASFLHRALTGAVLAPVEVPSDGSTVTVAQGRSFAAEFDATTVEAPAGALSGEAQVSLSETSAGTTNVPEGEELAAAPIAVGITGADIARPLTFRVDIDTSSLTETGVVPAWYSDELGSWVPLDTQSVVIGDGEVTFTANLADAKAVSAPTAFGPVLFAGPAGLGAPSGALDYTLAIPFVIVVGIIIFVAVLATVTVVALTSDTVHDALKRFFGLVVDEPDCGSGFLPHWVESVSDSDASLSRERARLHTCAQSAANSLRVKVANNRNYGVQIAAPAGSYPVSMPGGNNPTGLLDVAIKELAEEFIGESYLWPLSQSEFLLPPQPDDWTARSRSTGPTAVVDAVRIGVDLLKVALPAIESLNNAGLITCVRALMDHFGRHSVDVTSPQDWKAVLGTAASCFNPGEGASQGASRQAIDALKQVKNALGWVSTASSATKWGLTLADAIKDLNVADARINVSVKPDAPVPTPPPDMIDNTLDGGGIVSAGGFHSCGRTLPYRYISCWGDNAAGQLDAPLGEFTMVSAGGLHSCGLKTDGTITCWNADDLGQSDAPSGRFDAVSAGFDYSCGLRTGGTITCWGTNDFGQARAPGGRFATVSAGVDHACGLRTEGAITCWGTNDVGQSNAPSGSFKAVSAGNAQTCGLRTDGTITCWGNNLQGQADAPSGSFKAVSAGGGHSCGLRTDGTITCWGNNDDRQTAAPSGQFAAVSAGVAHSCGLRTDGTITCWGRNVEGQADAPSTKFANVVATAPVDDTPDDELPDDEPPPPTTAQDVLSAGAFHTCAIATDRTISCWGHNKWGISDAPAGTYRAVTTGRRHSCAIATDNTIRCWGAFDYAPAGTYRAVSASARHACAIATDNTIRCWAPNVNLDGQTEAPAGTYKAVSAGRAHTCAIATNDTIACWGAFDYAPAGTYKAISAGGAHTCAIATDNTITCWGNNDYGQTEAPTGTYKAVTTRGAHTCAIATDNTITCWGNNDYGQTEAPTGTYKAVTAGGSHACAIATDNTITCWGHNGFRQADASPLAFKAVTANRRALAYHGCAIATDNTITCWGNSTTSGQADAPTGSYQAITAGDYHTCAIATDNTITCWGNNDYGQTEAPAGTYKAITAGDTHTCAIATDNTITCWGNNDHGKADAPAGTYKTVTAGGYDACAIATDNTITCWGRRGQSDAPAGTYKAVSAGGSHACAIATDNTITCWGTRTHAPAGTYKAISAGSGHACAIATDNTVTCWGFNRYGGADAPAGTYKAVAAGGYHTCAIATDNRISCWGDFAIRMIPHFRVYDAEPLTG